MKTEHIDEFITLSHYLNFSMAASKLHLSQSTLSKHISELESELGVTLFSRGKSIALTPAGTAFQERILPAHHLLKEAVAYCRDVEKNTVEQLIIQEPYNMDLMSSFVFKAIGIFRSQSAEGFIKLISERGRSSTELLDDNIVDLAVTVDYGTIEQIRNKSSNGSYYFFPVVQEKLMAWVRKDGPLGGRKSIDAQSLLGKRIYMTAARQFDPMRFAISNWFMEATGALPQLRSLSTSSINDFYSHTQKQDSIFIITPSISHLPVLATNDTMELIEIEDENAVITSSLVARSDYAKQSIDLFFDIVEEAARSHASAN